MEIKILFLIILVIIILLLYISFQSKTTFKKVKIRNIEIEAEVADTIPKQIKGLMFRKNLPERSGMLFVFDSDDYHGIWMMNTSIPLDIIWISSDYKIISIQKDARPCSLDCRTYSPDKPARYVLEVNAGFTDKYSIKIGDDVKF